MGEGGREKNWFCRPLAPSPPRPLVFDGGEGKEVDSVDLVIGCFLGDDDIVDVAFTQSSTGDADETGALA